MQYTIWYKMKKLLLAIAELLCLGFLSSISQLGKSQWPVMVFHIRFHKAIHSCHHIMIELLVSLNFLDIKTLLMM